MCLKSLIAFMTSVLISIIGFFTPAVPEPKTAEELDNMPSYFKEHELPDKLYVVDADA